MGTINYGGPKGVEITRQNGRITNVTFGIPREAIDPIVQRNPTVIRDGNFSPKPPPLFSPQDKRRARLAPWVAAIR
jgi:hypothetical protein